MTVDDLPAWPPTRAEMRACLERLRRAERAEGTWMKRANTLLAERLGPLRSQRIHYLAPAQRKTVEAYSDPPPARKVQAIQAAPDVRPQQYADELD